MEIVGDRKFVEVPGSKNYELPPLLVRMVPDGKRLDKVMGMANDLIEQEDMIPARPLDVVVPESDPGGAARDGPSQDGARPQSCRLVFGIGSALAVGRQHPRMDPPVRDDV
jgi:hypothetical protein